MLNFLFARGKKRKARKTYSSSRKNRLKALAAKGLRFEPLEERQMLSVAPVVGSLSSSQDWVQVGNLLTLTANDVSATEGNIAEVSFYSVNGGTETLIGTDTEGTDGWNIDFDTTCCIADNYTLMAVACDVLNNFSNPATHEISVIGSNQTAIENLAQLQAIPANSSGNYVLVHDLDASETADPSYNNGQGFAPLQNFQGKFDGRGHVIRNLTIDRPDTTHIGLFGTTGNALIVNLGLEDVQVDGKYCIGGLVGVNYGGTISGCYTTGAITGHAGDSSTNPNCFGYDGGLVGGNCGVIIDSYSTASVASHGATGGLWGAVLGGLVGFSQTGAGTNVAIRNSYATGSVVGNGIIGGLAGLFLQSGGNTQVIDNCYATGDVQGSWKVGGFVGEVSGGVLVSDCFTTGDVQGGWSEAPIGAFVANTNGSPSFVNDYYSNCAALTQGTPYNQTGTTSTSPANFSNVGFDVYTRIDETWNFVAVWNITEDLPQLRKTLHRTESGRPVDAPLLWISGDTNVTEGAPYTLNLFAYGPGAEAISSWTIDWGDGQTEILSGSPSAAIHVYADGDADYAISATATDGVRTYTNIGFLDPTFGLGGAATACFDGFIWCQSMALQADGKIVEAGIGDSGNFNLVRFNADGTLDAGFGNGGTVSTDEGAYTFASSLVVQTDGRIVVCGLDESGYLRINRYLSDGTQDMNFGSGGLVQRSDFGGVSLRYRRLGDPVRRQIARGRRNLFVGERLRIRALPV